MIGEKEQPQVRIHRYAETCELLFGQSIAFYRELIGKGFISPIDFSNYHVMITGLPRQVYRPQFGMEAFSYSRHFETIEKEIASDMAAFGVQCMTAMLLYDHTKRFVMIFSPSPDHSALEIAQRAAAVFDRYYESLFDLEHSTYRNYTVLSDVQHDYEHLKSAFACTDGLSVQCYFDADTALMTPQLFAALASPADEELVHEQIRELFSALRQGDQEGIQNHCCTVFAESGKPRSMEYLIDVLHTLREGLDGFASNCDFELTDNILECFVPENYATIFELKEAVTACFCGLAGNGGRHVPGNHQIREAARYLRHHYREDISVDTVARYIGMSSSWLSRHFHIECGCSIPVYIQRVRMEQAVKLLETTEKTVAQIAEETGFATPRYFVTLFKKRFGNTPSQYREEKKAYH